MEKITTIVVGNQGVGKSSILNSLANQNRVFFPSNCFPSVGGLTINFQRETIGDNIFADTPGGLDDRIGRRQAGSAIEMALNAGGRFRIFFTGRLGYGKGLDQDIAAMALVLDAAPSIGKNYRLIINQVTKAEANQLRDKDSKDQTLEYIREEIDCLNLPWCGDDNVFFVLDNEKLKYMKDVFVPSDELVDIYGTTLTRIWIDCQLAELKENSVNTICVDLFEKVAMQNDQIRTILDEQNAKLKKLQTWKQDQERRDKYRMEKERIEQETKERLKIPKMIAGTAGGLLALFTGCPQLGYKAGEKFVEKIDDHHEKKKRPRMRVEEERDGNNGHTTANESHIVENEIFDDDQVPASAGEEVGVSKPKMNPKSGARK